MYSQLLPINTEYIAENFIIFINNAVKTTNGIIRMFIKALSFVLFCGVMVASE